MQGFRSPGGLQRFVSMQSATRNPSAEQTSEALAVQRGETIVPSGAAAANTLGLTTQVPVKSVCCGRGSGHRHLS